MRLLVQRLKLKYDEVVKTFAFSSHWRPYALEDELADIHSWGTFDVFAVQQLSGGHALTSVVLATLKALNLHTKLLLDMKVMERFCLAGSHLSTVVSRHVKSRRELWFLQLALCT